MDEALGDHLNIHIIQYDLEMLKNSIIFCIFSAILNNDVALHYVCNTKNEINRIYI